MKLEIIAIQPILPTKNNRQQMFGERTETEAKRIIFRLTEWFFVKTSNMKIFKKRKTLSTL